MDGQEKRLVAKLGNERKLALHEIADFLRCSDGKAPLQSLFGQLAQPARRGFAVGDELLGIFVTQLFQRETAALGDAHGLGEQIGRIDLRQAHAQPQMPLGIGMERVAASLHCRAQADSRQRVLQRPAGA